MLVLRNISKYYYTNKSVNLALRNINLEMKIGEFIAITGESGSGKSTLLNVLSGLDSYEDGKIFFNGEDISYYSQEDLEEFRRQHIGFVLQNYNIIENYTVMQNVEMVYQIKGIKRKERRKRSIELIKKVGLFEKIHQKASELSGGEKQLTVIARAIAKDSKILVCDEPTGNLDHESSMNVLRLLHEVSKDKLVIVVTHQYNEIEKYVTRKIRIHDGEIIEDKTFDSKKIVDDVPENKDIYNVNWYNQLLVALKNVLSVPKKTLFATLVMSFIISLFVYIYGTNMNSKNTSIISENRYFENASKSRIIVTKYDDSTFDISEIEELKNIKYVRGIVESDVVLDSKLVSSYYDSEFDDYQFIDYKIHTAISLNDSDLLEGRLPEEDNEVVIAESEIYELNDILYVSNINAIKKLDEVKLNDYTFKIVGIVKSDMDNTPFKNDIYLTLDTIEEIKYEALSKYNQIYLIIDEILTYGIWQDIRVDNSLKDNEVLTTDMMFFNICRDLGYKKEVADDFDAGLCPPNEWLFPYHSFQLIANTIFDNEPIPFYINFKSLPVLNHPFGDGMYMNENTYKKLFDEANYQVSVIVYDKYEADIVKKKLNKLGYNTLYPSENINEEEATKLIIRNAQLDVSFILISMVIYFVGFYVINNIINSNKSTYLIYRAMGCSKKNIRNILQYELFLITIITYVSVIMIFELKDSYILRYVSLKTHIFLLGVVMLLVTLMVRKFINKLFNDYVITSFRKD